jgi:peptidoglycan/LPS O-acetylase OafA/YrhL
MITPLLMWLFVWNKIVGWVVMALLLAGSFLSTALIVHHYDLSSAMVSPRYGRYMDYIYEKPYCRISPYLVGMALAFALIYVQKHKLQRFARWMIYLVALTIMSLCFYGDYENYHHTDVEDPNRSSHWSKEQDLVYITFSRFGWAVGVSLLAYPMIVGYGKQLAAFLGHSLWLPFARLTYGAYLVHIILISALFQNLKHYVYYGSTVVTWAFVACAFFAYGVSFVFYLLVEKPMMNIEKMVLG